MEQFVRTAHALSDPTRVRVLHLLMQRECCVCEVVDVLGVSQVNASRYCNTLKDAGLLVMRKEGRWKLYSVDRNRCSAAQRDMMQAVAATARTSELCRLDLQRLASVRRRPVSEAIAGPTLAQQSA